MRVLTNIARTFEKDSYTDKEVEDRILSVLAYEDPASEDFAKMADNLEKVRKARSYNRHPVLTELGNGCIAVIGSIGGILIITHAEEVQILTSKAMQYLIKPKI